MHKIKAQLYENTLAESENDYIARVVAEKSLSVENICQSAISRSGVDISTSEMTTAVNLWLKEMAHNLCNGFAVSAGYFNVQPIIKGTFSGPSDTYNPDKHSVLFSFNQGALLRKKLASVDVNITGMATTINITQVIDIRTNSVNDLLTPNRNLKICGNKIKVLGESNENGVYFVNQETQTKTKVEASDIVMNKPSELMIIVPDLETGTYQVEVTTQYGSGNSNKQLLKEPRTAAFEKLLTV
jgi:hypothetical protein